MKKLLLYCCFLWCTLVSFSQKKSISVGDSVPNFKLWFTDGTKLTQNNIKDKVVVFKFWFTTCLPCVIDISTLNELVVELEDRNDILFIAPALDRKEVIEKFLNKHIFKFKIAYSAIDVSQVFNKNQVYPSYVVINKKGKISYIDSNTKQSHFKPLKTAILKALKEN